MTYHAGLKLYRLVAAHTARQIRDVTVGQRLCTAFHSIIAPYCMVEEGADVSTPSELQTIAQRLYDDCLTIV